MKKNIIFIILIMLLVSFVNAQQEINYDCQLGGSQWLDLEPQLQGYLQNAKQLKTDDIEMAHKHLKSYCCAMKFLTDPKQCAGAKSPSSDFPESPYLMDHLIDIGFKKLDGDPNRSYGLEVDSMGKDYRKQVREKSEKREGIKPEEYKELYSSFWDNKDADPQSSLTAKYRNVCEETYSISMLMFKMYSSDKRGEGVDRCKSSAESRINTEKTYVESISMSKAIKYYKDNLNDYMKDYFTKTRMPYLLDKLKKIVGNSGHVDKKSSKTIETAGGSK